MTKEKEIINDVEFVKVEASEDIGGGWRYYLPENYDAEGFGWYSISKRPKADLFFFAGVGIVDEEYFWRRMKLQAFE